MSKFKVTYQDRSIKQIEAVNAIEAFNQAGEDSELLVLYVNPVPEVKKPKK
jgi:hypothetical protein